MSKGHKLQLFRKNTHSNIKYKLADDIFHTKDGKKNDVTKHGFQSRFTNQLFAKFVWSLKV